jgi:hypothetical protein
MTVDPGWDHRGHMDDHRRCGIGDQPINLCRVRQVCPARPDTGGQQASGFALGSRAQVGRDDAVAVGNQLTHGLRTD